MNKIITFEVRSLKKRFLIVVIIAFALLLSAIGGMRYQKDKESVEGFQVFENLKSTLASNIGRYGAAAVCGCFACRRNIS